MKTTEFPEKPWDWKPVKNPDTNTFLKDRFSAAKKSAYNIRPLL